jgi:hypothetical protein
MSPPVCVARAVPSKVNLYSCVQLAEARKLSNRVKTTLDRWFGSLPPSLPVDRFPSQAAVIASPPRPMSPLRSSKSSSPNAVSEGYILHDDDGPTTKYGSVKSSRRMLSPSRRQHQPSEDGIELHPSTLLNVPLAPAQDVPVASADGVFPGSPGGRVFTKPSGPRKSVDLTHHAYQEL